jgi:hypothetical protein
MVLLIGVFAKLNGKYGYDFCLDICREEKSIFPDAVSPCFRFAADKLFDIVSKMWFVSQLWINVSDQLVLNEFCVMLIEF